MPKSRKERKAVDTKFLQSLRVGDAPLPGEVVDAILAEHQREMEAAKKPFADYEALKSQLTAAKEGLKAFEGVDVQNLRGQVEKLTRELADQETQHKARLAELEFDSALKEAVTAAGGRSAKAIRALLDVDALKKSNNREADIKAALEGLRKESGYLFEERREPPPPYAAGPGTAPAAGGKYDQRMAAIRAAAGLKND